MFDNCESPMITKAGCIEPRQKSITERLELERQRLLERAAEIENVLKTMAANPGTKEVIDALSRMDFRL